MADQTPTYSFLPWLRIGVANNITQPDQDASLKVRATLPVDVTIAGTNLDGTTASQAIHKDISLYGPGDLVGIDNRAILKVDPCDGITNFEPNFLPYLECYEEDFFWRYTPARADAAQHQLRPWAALVVLKEGEFTEGTNIQNKPLPFIELAGVNATDVFPIPTQLWAWAHVHVNRDLTDPDTSMPGVISRLQANLTANPDRAYARILCPRHLEPKIKYSAFLIPTFETGRLAGLGEVVPDTTIATASAWESGQTAFPYYYRWSFVTGTQGDFEFLVKILKPQPADKKVGVRDIDVLHPGSNLPAINLPAELHGVLKLGGALRVPVETLLPADQAEVKKYDEWDEHPYPHPFEQAMAGLINLADDYTTNKAEDANPDHDPDPIITMPLYGRWHALVNRLLKNANGTDVANPHNWIHELNLDPRFRVAAGLGTNVIQKNQEEYMNSAWAQIGDVIAANNQLRFAAVGLEASVFVYQKNLVSLNASKAFVLTAPVHKRVVSDGLTVYGHTVSSVVPNAVVSAQFRKMTRPGAAVMKHLNIATLDASTQFVPGINGGQLLPAPVKVAPAGAVKLSDAAAAVDPLVPEPPIPGLLGRFPWLRWLPLVVALLVILLILMFQPGLLLLLVLLALIVLMVVLFFLLSRAAVAPPKEPAIDEKEQTPAAVDLLPAISNFQISVSGDGFAPLPGTVDSDEGVRFKTALKDAYTFVSIKFPQPVKTQLNLPALTNQTLATINPVLSIPKRVLSGIVIPDRIKTAMVETFAPVMAYPIFDIPMYKPLAGISAELFLPNINLIPPNSITLLESNQKFIESYMVGLNHEMARELLWREYITDQRGSYFRQFWDVSSVFAERPTEAERERLRDTPKIHLWSKLTELGKHNQRETEGDPAQLVLVIRGELLKKYPTAVIYAQRADWHRKPDGSLDATVDRDLIELTAAEESAERPPADKIRKPLFEAKVDPDIYFLGFNLNAGEARGGTRTDQDAGWFFVIKERPGEPRFGFDVVEDNELPRLINWNNLTWNHVGTAEGGCIDLSNTIGFQAYNAGIDQENRPNPDDAQARWFPGTNSAELAYILYQVPVLVAVHASRMLP